MNAIDVCAGAGGLSLGLQRAGWQVLGVEQDGDACATHRSQVGPCDQADLRTWVPPGPVDLVAGGPPCQPFSQAGQRQGTADPRGQLYLHLLRIADEADARIVCMENVRGLIYRGLDEVLSAFWARGWHTTWALLDAADYGVPQHRRRVFIVGTRARVSFRFPSPTHGPDGLFKLRSLVTVRQSLGLSGAVDGGTVLDRPSPCITAGEGRACGNLGAKGGHARARKAGDTLGPALLALDQPAPAPGSHERRQRAVRLTVTQIARLQAFPDGFVFFGSLTSQYRQVGNAVPPTLAEAMGLALRAALSQETSE